MFKDEKHDMDVLVDPADWFGDEDVSNFINWGDVRLDLLDKATLIVAEELEPVLPSMTVKVKGLSIPDEYVDHIRFLQKKEK